MSPTRIAAVLAGLCLLGLSSCGPFWDIWAGYEVRGQLLDGETLEPLRAERLVLGLWLDGEELDHTVLWHFGTEPENGEDGEVPETFDGNFEASILSGWCGGNVTPWGRTATCSGMADPSTLLAPDTLVVTATVDGCVREVSVDLPEDIPTELEVGEYDLVLELADPILVPPCSDEGGA